DGRAAGHVLPHGLSRSQLRADGLALARARSPSGAARRLLPLVHPRRLAGAAPHAAARARRRARRVAAGAAAGGSRRGRVGAGIADRTAAGMSAGATMRAALLPAPGTPLRIVDLELSP